MRGGYREGAGRKVGFAAKNAEEARRYLSQRVMEDIEPLADLMLGKAKAGNIRALQLLLDRAWGRSRQEIEITESRNPLITPETEGYLQELSYVVGELQKMDFGGVNLTETVNRFTQWCEQNRTSIQKTPLEEK